MSLSLSIAAAFSATGEVTGDVPNSQERHNRGTKVEHFLLNVSRHDTRFPLSRHRDWTSLMSTPSARSTNPLGPTERAVLTVLVSQAGRVVSRQNLVRMAGLAHLSPRRCDTAIVSLRRMLGSTAIQTVRSRGWMLLLSALDEANKLL